MPTYVQLCMFEEYEPEVNDYVIWEDGTPGKSDEGWVYFKGDKIEPKKGFNTQERYITIETGIKKKPKCKYTKDEQHKYIHTLLLCYESQWHQLKFVKKRKHRKE